MTRWAVSQSCSWSAADAGTSMSPAGQVILFEACLWLHDEHWGAPVRWLCILTVAHCSTCRQSVLYPLLQVLHLAEVLHNTPKHALCVKALRRRAAAYQVSAFSASVVCNMAA